MEGFLVYLMVGLLVLPFVALTLEAVSKLNGLLIISAGSVAAVSVLIAFCFGGFQARPRIANLFLIAFCLWPIALIIAKIFNPSLSWRSLWLSVPVMSWYLVNMSMQFYYPVNAGGGGLGLLLGFIAGWFYMVIPFALLNGIFIAIKRIVEGKG